MSSIGNRLLTPQTQGRQKLELYYDKWKKECNQCFAIMQLRVSNNLSEQNDDSQKQQGDGNSAMESSQFRLDPGVEASFQSSPLFGVCTVEFQRTGIAGSRRRPVSGNLPSMVGVQLHQLVARRAFPVVELPKLDKSGIAIRFRPLLRTAR
jgi:hypothetical protein